MIPRYFPIFRHLYICIAHVHVDCKSVHWYVYIYICMYIYIDNIEIYWDMLRYNIMRYIEIFTLEIKQTKWWIYWGIHCGSGRGDRKKTIHLFGKLFDLLGNYNHEWWHVGETELQSIFHIFHGGLTYNPRFLDILGIHVAGGCFEMSQREVAPGQGSPLWQMSFGNLW
jgi:hypothetical protein